MTYFACEELVGLAPQLSQAVAMGWHTAFFDAPPAWVAFARQVVAHPSGFLWRRGHGLVTRPQTD